MLIGTTELKDILNDLESLGYYNVWIEGNNIWLGMSNLIEDLKIYEEDTRLIQYLTEHRYEYKYEKTRYGFIYFGFVLN